MMQINSKVRYGLRTMIEIALQENNKGIFQKDIAKNQSISEKYLDQIISSLKASDLISKTNEGYVLSKSQNNISIYDIYKSFEPELYIVQCIKKSAICNGCNSLNCESSNKLWKQLNTIIVEFLKTNTLEDIVKDHKK